VSGMKEAAELVEFTENGEAFRDIRNFPQHYPILNRYALIANDVDHISKKRDGKAFKQEHVSAQMDGHVKGLICSLGLKLADVTSRLATIRFMFKFASAKDNFA